MCRMCVCFSHIKSQETNAMIIAHLLELEKARGGDGCGFFLFNEIHKSMHTYSILHFYSTPFMYHTRKANHGAKISIANCHPFKNRNLIMMHNGTDPDYTLRTEINGSKELLDYFVESNKDLASLKWEGNIICYNIKTKKLKIYVRIKYEIDEMILGYLPTGELFLTSQLTESLKLSNTKRIKNGIYIASIGRNSQITKL